MLYGHSDAGFIYFAINSLKDPVSKLGDWYVSLHFNMLGHQISQRQDTMTTFVP